MTWPLKIVRISGHSMMPLIKPGSLILVNQWAYIFRPPKIGDVVVFRNPKNKSQLFCKRVARITGDNFIMRGDNQSDSLDVAPTPRSLILGRCLLYFKD